ncbi:MAG: response regulator [Beijerinckiaceae bacterium]|nr:response regulator [Beijerinckiaceae bacterium]
MDSNRATRPAVLIVEDDPLIRWSGAETLAEAGFEVLEAANGDEALAVLEARSDILVLFTDIDMPGQMDGLDLAAIVHQRWPWMHIIIASGRREPQRRGIPDNGLFIPKPYMPEEVVRDIDALLAA